KRKGSRIAPPKFKSRTDHQHAIRLTRNGFSIRPNGRLYVAKAGELKARWSRQLPSEAYSIIVVKDAAWRYFASFVVEAPGEAMPETDTVVGIDLALTHFAVLCDGCKVASPKCLRRVERRLKSAQRALSR